MKNWERLEKTTAKKEKGTLVRGSGRGAKKGDVYLSSFDIHIPAERIFVECKYSAKSLTINKDMLHKAKVQALQSNMSYYILKIQIGEDKFYLVPEEYREVC